jgi:hypothetical protein
MVPTASVVKIDPAFNALMPGCYARGYNQAAEELFGPEFGAEFKEKFDPVVKGDEFTQSICDGLLAPSTPLFRWCPLESTYKTWLQSGEFHPGLHVLGRGTLDLSRNYRLYMFHAAKISCGADGRTLLRFRLLPFPKQMGLRITSTPAPVQCTTKGRLAPLPAGVTVEVDYLNYRKEIDYYKLGEDTRTTLLAARAFLNQVLAAIDDKKTAPADAWRETRGYSALYSEIEKEIPDPLRQKFIGNPDKRITAGEAACEIRSACENGLDAPVLMTVVFNDILDRIREDHELRLTPGEGSTTGDRRQYYRLHIPVESLNRQDQYIGWLPMRRAYRHERNVVLEQLYGNADRDTADSR